MKFLVFVKNIKSCPNNRFRNPYNNISRTNYTICLHHGTLVHICFRRESMTSFTFSRKKNHNDTKRTAKFVQNLYDNLAITQNMPVSVHIAAHTYAHIYIYIYMYAHTTICANPLHKSWVFQTETN